MAVWYHRLTLDRSKPRIHSQSLNLSASQNAMPMPMSPMHCTIFEIRKTTRNLYTHISHHIYIHTYVCTIVATPKSQYPRVVYNSKAMINHQSGFLFCFVSFWLLVFFIFSSGRGEFSLSGGARIVCTSDSHLGRPQKRLHVIAHSHNGRKLPISGAC